MIKFKTLSEQNDKELKVAQASIIKIKDEKASIENELRQLKEYSRKLEHRLVSEVNKAGGGSITLSEIIQQQRE